MASPLLSAITTALRFWPIFLLAVFNQGGGMPMAFILIGGGFVALAVEVLRFLRFDYRLQGTTLVVRSGVLVRRSRSVPADRVQQVSLNQKLRHRVLGLAEVSVEVAGAGSEPDVKLSVVSRNEAERIRLRLQDARRVGTEVPPERDRVVYSQPNRDLLRWAVFSSPLFMLPAIGAAIGALDDAVDVEQAWGWLPDGSQLWFAALAALLGLAGATAFNGARYYDMLLLRSDNDFRLTYGLFTNRQLEVPPGRIQALVTKLSLAGRLSRTSGITVHNASSAGESTESYLPATPRRSRREVIDLLIPNLELDPPMRRHPPGALRRSVIRWVWPVAVVTLVALALIRRAPAAALVLLVLPAAALGWRSWRVLGHGETPDVVVSRRGAITERTSIVKLSRIQSLSVAANFFQRRLGLATVQIQVAQPLGRVTVKDMDATEATALAARLLANRKQDEETR
ncbi:MAG: PH domain-containing protein [bacterium]|nr:PH domain-containing protein [bacterium]